MVNLSTVYVPAYEFHFNLIVYPLPATARKTVSLGWGGKRQIKFTFLLRAAVTSTSWKTMKFTPNQQEGHTGWSSCLTMSTVSCHLCSVMRVRLEYLGTFQKMWKIFCTAWKYCRCVVDWTFLVLVLNYSLAKVSICESKLHEDEKEEIQTQKAGGGTISNIFPSIPGLDPTATLRSPTDENLPPLEFIPSKSFQYGQTNLISISTDHPQWSPGFCLYLEKYAGICKVKTAGIYQQVLLFALISWMLKLNDIEK